MTAINNMLRKLSPCFLCRRRRHLTCASTEDAAESDPGALSNSSSSRSSQLVSQLLSKMRVVDTWKRPLVVRSMSGKIVHSQEEAGDRMRLAHIVNVVCEKTKTRADEIRLMHGTVALEQTMHLGQCIAPPESGVSLEVSMAVVQGPPVTAESMSGSRIEVLEGAPTRRSACHFDREYVFTGLGGFANRDHLLYIKTSNDDRKTRADRVMWRLDVRVPATVYVNFRSERHLATGGAADWLNRDGWKEESDFPSTISSGFPNGPYSGPVYAKSILPENRRYVVDLMGSNYWEGTYFVFVQLDSPEG